MITVNGNKIKISHFPNGEANVDTTYLNTLSNTKGNSIVFKYEEDGDLVHLLFVLDHLLSISCAVNNIIFTYMPYSRMDRQQDGNCFTLRYILSMFKTHMMFNTFYVAEPHSAVTLDNGNIKPIYVTPTLCVKALRENQDINAICFPDKGARDRYMTLFSEMYPELNEYKTLYCNKVRDFKTGKITGLELVGDTEGVDSVLIADDLCSAGGTFYYTAQKLKENGIQDVYLCVTHMEWNVVNGELIKETSPIKKIYTTDSMMSGYEISLKEMFGERLDIHELGSISEVENE